MAEANLLIIDDDLLFCKVLRYQLGVRKYDCEFVDSSVQALKRLQHSPPPDLILLDYFLGPQDLNGLQLCSQIKSICTVPVIMLTANDEVRTTISCLDAGADLQPWLRVLLPIWAEDLWLHARVAGAIVGRAFFDHSIDLGDALALAKQAREETASFV